MSRIQGVAQTYTVSIPGGFDIEGGGCLAYLGQVILFGY